MWLPRPESSAAAVLHDGLVDGIKGFGRQATRLFLPVVRDSVAAAGAAPGYARRGSWGPRALAQRAGRPAAALGPNLRPDGGGRPDRARVRRLRQRRGLGRGRPRFPRPRCRGPAVLGEESVVHAMVPVSVRSADERAAASNRVLAVAVDLPCGEAGPLCRLRLLQD